ncbi:hypothetical protein CGRA01v4_02777 [Colletotrichum graminicola]|nr:hypothetical protein CGRA01v4_02777 [Colletotrichum graminicola]
MQLANCCDRPPPSLSDSLSVSLLANDASALTGIYRQPHRNSLSDRSPLTPTLANPVFLYFGQNHESSSAPNPAASALPLEQDEARNILLHALSWVSPFVAMQCNRPKTEHAFPRLACL